jgi:hypothetical protein
MVSAHNKGSSINRGYLPVPSSGTFGTGRGLVKGVVMLMSWQKPSRWDKLSRKPETKTKFRMK